MLDHSLTIVLIDKSQRFNKYPIFLTDNLNQFKNICKEFKLNLLIKSNSQRKSNNIGSRYKIALNNFVSILNKSYRNKDNLNFIEFNWPYAQISTLFYFLIVSRKIIINLIDKPYFHQHFNNTYKI